MRLVVSKEKYKRSARGEKPKVAKTPSKTGGATTTSLFRSAAKFIGCYLLIECILIICALLGFADEALLGMIIYSGVWFALNSTK